MRSLVIVVLFVFWMFMAYRALQRGDVVMAVLFAIVGVVLTAYRLRRPRLVSTKITIKGTGPTEN